MQDLAPVKWKDDAVEILDQRALPFRVERLRCTSVSQVAEAIRTLAVRGAPAIGIAAAYAAALSVRDCADLRECLERVDAAASLIRSTRPTARNLFWALERVVAAARRARNAKELTESVLEEARRIHDEEIQMDKKLAKLGSELIEDGYSVLTHCNTGELATGGYGSALGVIKAAWEAGKRISVYATETRPLLQGARLTMLELLNAGIPAKLIVDSASGYLMKLGQVNAVIVGADRILADGTTANKIGTYTLALLANHHGIPFYVAAPYSTFDLESKEIAIEFRSEDEVKRFRDLQVAHDQVRSWNPAFDVTPPHLITGIVTERGILRPPYTSAIRSTLGNGMANGV